MFPQPLGSFQRCFHVRYERVVGEDKDRLVAVFLGNAAVAPVKNGDLVGRVGCKDTVDSRSTRMLGREFIDGVVGFVQQGCEAATLTGDVMGPVLLPCRNDQLR
jgi:hypothetical protein